MRSNQPQPARPPTIWFGDPNWSAQETKSAQSSPISQVKGSSVSTKLRNPHLKRHKVQSSSPEAQGSRIQTLNGSPWVDYEKGIEIFPKKQVSLCRNREHKSELAHVQQLELDRSTAQLQVATIERLAHRSFPQLLRCYFHENLTFLVWEPVELSLSQIMGSKYSIKESELVSIVWPILRGIRYLRDCGRALATLTTDTILFTEPGGVKITGLEHSCEIDNRDMNEATLKLSALSGILKELKKKMDLDHPWSSEAQDLAGKLTTIPLNDLLR
ncbi:hypothetical protein N7523_010267, partial [Penicillium sp. IBT 18751x]